jgi:lysophospholipase L1-like esterase
VQILGTLRAVAGPDTRIVISTYDNPLGACVLAPFEDFGDLVLEGGPGFSIGFNDVIKLVAAATGAEVADMFGELADDDWVGGQDCTHPDISGYHKMAEVFLGVLD